MFKLGLKIDISSFCYEVLQVHRRIAITFNWLNNRFIDHFMAWYIFIKNGRKVIAHI